MKLFVKLANQEQTLTNVHVSKIAESLLHFCGLSETRLEPNGDIVFTVSIIPDDIPQVGISWIKVEYPTFESNIFRDKTNL